MVKDANTVMFIQNKSILNEICFKGNICTLCFIRYKIQIHRFPSLMPEEVLLFLSIRDLVQSTCLHTCNLDR